MKYAFNYNDNGVLEITLTKNDNEVTRKCDIITVLCDIISFGGTGTN